MRRAALILAIAPYLCSCKMDVEEADARCVIIGGKPSPSTPVDETRWFQMNCERDALGLGCYAPGSARSRRVAAERPQAQARVKKALKWIEEADAMCRRLGEIPGGPPGASAGWVIENCDLRDGALVTSPRVKTKLLTSVATGSTP